MEAAVILAQSVNKSQMPPLHQKRILAFVNHFLIQSCTFLNEFGTKCESKFFELERKMQKAEAALAIIEAKLASIPDAETVSSTMADTSSEVRAKAEYTVEQLPVNNEELRAGNESSIPADVKHAATGIRVCDEIRYKKFFQMVLFGVPVDAVKMKMRAEGVDANILDTPGITLPDALRTTVT